MSAQIPAARRTLCVRYPLSSQGLAHSFTREPRRGQTESQEGKRTAAAGTRGCAPAVNITQCRPHLRTAAARSATRSHDQTPAPTPSPAAARPAPAAPVPRRASRPQPPPSATELPAARRTRAPGRPRPAPPHPPGRAPVSVAPAEEALGRVSAPWGRARGRRSVPVQRRATPAARRQLSSTRPTDGGLRIVPALSRAATGSQSRAAGRRHRHFRRARRRAALTHRLPERPGCSRPPWLRPAERTASNPTSGFLRVKDSQAHALCDVAFWLPVAVP